MRQLMTEDGYGSAKAIFKACRESCTNGNAIYEVMKTVTNEYHKGKSWDAAVIFLFGIIRFPADRCFTLEKSETWKPQP